MFLRPFLKYFRPFIFRIVIAVVGMIVVGTLSAAPLLIFREAIQVLLDNDPGRRTQLEESGDMSGGMGSLIKGALSVPKATAAGEKATSGTQSLANAKPHRPKMKQRIDDWLTSRTGVIWTGPRDTYLAARAEVRGWYDRTLGPPVGRLRDWYRAQAQARPLAALAFLIGVLIVLTAIKGISEFVSKYELTYTFFYTNLHMREDIFGNVLRQDYLFFSKNSAGYLYSRISSDVKDLRGILESMLSDGIQQPITLVTMFAILLWLSWQLTIGVIFVLPVVAGLLVYFAKVLRKNNRKQKKKSDELSSSLTESLNNIRLVKAFGTEDVEIDKFHNRSMALFKYMMAQRLAKFGSSPLMEFLGSIAVAGVIMTGGWMIMGTHVFNVLGREVRLEQMPFSDFLIYLATLSRFYRPLRNLATMTNKYQVARVSAERMHQMLQLKPSLEEVANPKRFERLGEAIEFKEIDFSYGKGHVLDRVSLRVPVGRSVAFAGPSGSGKTTLINLLVRLFDPQGGGILVDGVDLREYKLDDWRHHLAIVTQDTYLFDDTIANNIAYGSESVDRARIEEAARAANAHEFIMGMDGGKGYDTVIGPMGTRLSGGQRQRVAIARAIYRDPQILVLDEATSALDSQSQAAVQVALAHLMQGRTTFIVAHRISTIRDVDCIYVLNEGRIAESGTHQQLVARGGLYASMVNHAQLEDAQIATVAGDAAPEGA